MHAQTPTHSLWLWPKRPPLAFSVAEMSGPKRPRPKYLWPKCPTFDKKSGMIQIFGNRLQARQLVYAGRMKRTRSVCWYSFKHSFGPISGPSKHWAWSASKHRLVHDGSKTDERPARLWAIWSNEKYLVFFWNILDPDHVQRNVGIDLEPNCLTLWCSHSKLYKKPSPDIIFKHFAPRSGSINLKTSGLRTCLLMTNKRVIQRNGSDPGVTANKNNIISI